MVFFSKIRKSKQNKTKNRTNSNSLRAGHTRSWLAGSVHPPISIFSVRKKNIRFLFRGGEYSNHELMKWKKMKNIVSLLGSLLLFFRFKMMMMMIPNHTRGEKNRIIFFSSLVQYSIFFFDFLIIIIVELIVWAQFLNINLSKNWRKKKFWHSFFSPYFF